MMANSTFSGYDALAVPIILSDREGKVFYRNALARRRLPSPRIGANIFLHVPEEDRNALEQCLQNGTSAILTIERRRAGGGRCLAFSLCEGVAIFAFFAELQPLLSAVETNAYISCVSELRPFFLSLADEPHKDPIPMEQRLLDAEAASGALTALLIGQDLVVGQTEFNIVSLFEELLVAVKSDIKRIGAQIQFRNSLSPSAYRYSRFALLPLCLMKLVLFSLLVAEKNRVDVEFTEHFDRHPMLEIQFRSKRRLPIMLDVDNFRAFAACFPQYYPMLFGYWPALSARGSKIAISVGEDGRDVSIRVKVCADLEAALFCNSPDKEITAAKLLVSVFKYSTSIC